MDLSQSALRHLEAPESDKALLTTREKIVLLQSAKVHDFVAPPWDRDPSDREFEEPYQDESNLHLSAVQQNLLHAWKPSPRVGKPLFRSDQGPCDLVQDVTNDCSVVASLCAWTARTERHGVACNALLASRIFPSSRLSPNGKYMFKLHLNGCDRRVLVDDRLPATHNTRLLYVVDRNDETLLWPALVEKALLKARGGYDFAGSLPSVDLWTLLGWIPEQVYLQSEDLLVQPFWRRIYKAFQFGDVLITAGTGKMRHREEEALGLASEHAYAIVDLDESNGERRLLVRNPWSDERAATPQIERHEPFSLTHDENSNVIRPGLFWLTFSTILQQFETIYLNWNPGLFKFRRDRHFTWKLSESRNAGSFRLNPQFAVRVPSDGTVWFLLTMHEHHVTQSTPQSSSASNTGAHSESFRSLSIFESTHRIDIGDHWVSQTPYSNSASVLLRHELLRGRSYVIVASEQDMPAQSCNFTLSVFSNSRLDIVEPASPQYPYAEEETGAWTTDTAGGNTSSSHHSSNPQYSLNLSGTSDIAILLEANDAEQAVNVKLLWLQGQRLNAQLRNQDIACQSGEYRRGCARATTTALPSGLYTVIVSAFHAGQQGHFTLRVEASAPDCRLKALPPPHAGRFVTRLPDAVFGDGINRILAPIQVSRLTKLSVRISVDHRRGPGRAASALRLTCEYGQGPETVELASSGDFSDGPGISTPDIDLTPRQCAESGPGVWLVVHRAGGAVATTTNPGGNVGILADGQYGSSAERAVIEVLSTEAGVTVGSWGRESDQTIEGLRGQLRQASLH